MIPEQGNGRHTLDAQEIAAPLGKLGFKLCSTGGGCEAWYLESGKHYVYLTSDDGTSASGLTTADPLWLGYYNMGQEHDDTIEAVEGDWVDIEPKIIAFQKGEWSPREKSTTIPINGLTSTEDRQVTISASVLQNLLSLASSHLDDMDSGFNEGIYDQKSSASDREAITAAEKVLTI